MLKLSGRWKHHRLQAPGDIQFRAHAQILLFQLLVEGSNLRICSFYFLLGGFERRDVMGNAECADNFALFVSQRHFGRQGPMPVAIRLFQRHKRFACSDDLLLLFIFAERLLFRKKVEIPLSNNLVGMANPHASCQRAIDFGEAALPVFKIDKIRNILHKRVEDIFLIRQFFRMFPHLPH